MRVHIFIKKTPEKNKYEIGLISALGLMFNVHNEIWESAAEMDEKNGLSATYQHDQHKEGLHIMDQMIKHNLTLFKSIFADRAKKNRSWFEKSSYVGQIWKFDCLL